MAVTIFFGDNAATCKYILIKDCEYNLYFVKMQEVWTQQFWHSQNKFCFCSRRLLLYLRFAHIY